MARIIRLNNHNSQLPWREFRISTTPTRRSRRKSELRSMKKKKTKKSLRLLLVRQTPMRMSQPTNPQALTKKSPQSKMITRYVQDEEDDEKAEISKREKARLKEMQKLKKLKIQEMLDSQNASIDADMNKGKGKLKYLLQQTELFAHFAKGDPSSSQKKAKGRCVEWGRHASKVTEEEEDEEYLKEEEDGLTGSGNTRLLTQPSLLGFGKLMQRKSLVLCCLVTVLEFGTVASQIL